MYSKNLLYKYFSYLLGTNYLQGVKIRKWEEERTVDVYYPEYSLAVELKANGSEQVEKRSEYGIHLLSISNPKQLLSHGVTDWLTEVTGVLFRVEYLPHSVVQNIKHYRDFRPKYSPKEKQKKRLQNARAVQKKETASNLIRQSYRENS